MSQLADDAGASMPRDAREIGTPEWNIWALLLMIVREFIIDLLGSLLPGLLFVFFAGALLLASVWLLWAAIADALPASNSVPALTSILTAYTSHLTLVTVALAYVIGCIFYRLDPKIPDLRSAEQILKRTSKEEQERAAIQPSGDANRKLRDDPGAQFPYSHLYEYLHTRGLEHLAVLLPWRGSDSKTRFFRTKMFINVLKIRLQFSCPEKCTDIVRNEAHVRLMSSVWFASSTLVWVAGVAILPGFLGVIIGHFWASRPLWTPFVALVLACGTVAFGAYVVQAAILQFLHYQRVRETVYVLEAAWFASERYPRILEGILQPRSTGDFGSGVVAAEVTAERKGTRG